MTYLHSHCLAVAAVAFLNSLHVFADTPRALMLERQHAHKRSVHQLSAALQFTTKCSPTLIGLNQAWGAFFSIMVRYDQMEYIFQLK